MVGCCARRAAYATNCCFCTQRCVVSPKGNGSVSRDQWLRALEQEILHTLFKCLASDSGNLDREGQAKRRHAHIMDKFEDALAFLAAWRCQSFVRLSAYRNERCGVAVPNFLA